ncbi:MAG: flagellar basal body rod protein FlgC [Lachnospiraceae bacterium]|nr:flagellar basal body rod protein FlgC [Lachnospiraceae bacterium]MBP3507234.1 flagellar basal body rod protein FlgC [Lachnospiraceae bacterium]
MSMFDGMNISATGMTAQRFRMDVISENIANINTTRDENGEVYRRKTVVFNEKSTLNFGDTLYNSLNVYRPNGVRVSQVVEDQSDLKMVYDPTHPDADENGYVLYPNVDTVTEMTNLIDSSRAYEANATAFNAAKSIAVKGLELFG